MDEEDSASLSSATQTLNSSELVEVETRRYPEYISYTAVIIGIPVMVTGILGNLLTIIAVLKTKTLGTGTNIFIISLSAFDLMYCCTVIPTVLTIHRYNAWVFSDVYCKVYPILQFSLVGEGLVCLTGTAVTRYLKILHPKAFKLIFGKKVNLFLFMCCLWEPIALLLSAMTRVWGKMGYEPKALTCTFLRDGTNYNNFLLLFGFISPIVVIIFCYLCILCKVCSNHRKITATRQNTAAAKDHISGVSGHQHPTGQKELRADLQLTKMMATIFIVFLLAYAPYMINNVFLDPDHDNLVNGFFTGCCVWLSACLNPVVYVLLNRQFQKAFMIMLPGCIRCKQDGVEQATSQHTGSTNTGP